MSIRPEARAIPQSELRKGMAAFNSRRVAFNAAEKLVYDYEGDGDLEKFGQSLRSNLEAAKALRKYPSLLEGRDARLHKAVAAVLDPGRSRGTTASKPEKDVHAQFDHASRTRTRNPLER